MNTAIFWVVVQRVAAVLTEVSGEPFGPILKDQESNKLLGY
jgi:hypothetical protein